MAEVDSIVSTLFQTVSQILITETKTILNASADLKSLQGDLKFMQEFLRRSEGERDEVKEEVKQFRVAVLEAENLIDDFVVKMAIHKRMNWLMRFFHGGEQIILLRNAAVKVKHIRKTIEGIIANTNKYNITSDEGGSSKRSAINKRRHHVEMEDVVCFINEAKLVMDKLDTRYSQRDVISIIGMGGLGKTTLARKIFNGDFVKNFDCAAWVNVSQAYNLNDLLQIIAAAVFPSKEMEEFNKELLHTINVSSTEEGKMKLIEGKLVEKLKFGLANKRYFIVLDDVWENLLWDEIKAAFPENNKRSRVLITSRVKEVALHASTRTPPYFLPFLEEDDSWKLFSRKVFYDQGCPPNLEKLVRQQILTKCKGLPLAIVVVAGLLKKRDQSKWSEVAENLNWHISKDSSECLGILALSYEELPPRLKPCFLYFAVYPEDFEIPVRNLIRLWVAEGFVDQDNETKCNLEDMAEEYLLELIDRSLIQVSSKRTDGGVKTCCIHDLLRDLAILECKREMFLSVERKLDESIPVAQPRRLSVHYDSRDLSYTRISVPKGKRNTEVPNLCTLSGSRLESKDDADILKMFPNLKKLKIGCFDHDLGVFEYLSKLHHLQVLHIHRKFRLTDPGALPLSLTKITLSSSELDASAFSKLGGLPNLQILKLKNSFHTHERKLETGSNQGQFPRLQVLIMCNLFQIEDWSMKGQGLQSLVHLSINGCFNLKSIPDQLKQLSSLRQLKVNSCHALKDIIEYIWANDARLIID